MSKRLDRMRELLATEVKLTLDQEEELRDLVVEVDVADGIAALAAMQQMYVANLLNSKP